jgi:hypothetical protein
VETYNAHCRDIIDGWQKIMEASSGTGALAGTNDVLGLRTVWVTAILTAAVDMGFERPGVGLL